MKICCCEAIRLDDVNFLLWEGINVFTAPFLADFNKILQQLFAMKLLSFSVTSYLFVIINFSCCPPIVVKSHILYYKSH